MKSSVRMQRQPASALTTMILSLILAVPATMFAETTLEPSPRSFRKADRLLKRMGIDEKIGQVIHIGINASYLNRQSAEFLRLKREITENKVGGIVVFAGPVYETVHLVNRLQALAKHPLLISADFETGVGMRFSDAVNFPWSMALSATGDLELARELGAVTGQEARALGVRHVFAPVLDINNNPLNPVINVRSFGEDPATVAAFGRAFAEGLQSRGVIATAKHFPGHGNTSVDSHRGLPEIPLTLQELEKNELVPFRELVNWGIGSVMVSHISMPELDDERVAPITEPGRGIDPDSQVITGAGTIPATLSRSIVTGLLKEELGFKGLVVTDALDMSGLTIYFLPGESAVRALLAGNDILLKPEDAESAISGIKRAVSEGRLPLSRIDDAVRKQIAWKYELGLFEKRITPLEEIDGIVSSPGSISLARSISEKALTLVKNDNGTLPLAAGSKVAVLCLTNGPDFNRVGLPFVSELSSAGYKVERIVIDDRSTEESTEAAVKRASDAEIIIAAFFSRVRSGSPNSIGIPENGEKAVRAFLAKGKRTMAISFGNPYVLNGFPEISAYVVAYGDMESLQIAAAQKLAGRSDFGGKLPISLNGKFRIGHGISVSPKEDRR